MMKDDDDIPEHWGTFTADLNAALMEAIEDTRDAALFREMAMNMQLTAIMSALVGTIFDVIVKGQLHDSTFDQLHRMLELGRQRVREQRDEGKTKRSPVRWMKP